jgi:cytochrome c-type protein NapB
MRLGTPIVVWALALVPVLIAANASAQREVDDGMDVYFRDVDLSAVSDQDLAKYRETEAGESKAFERSFPGAPPLIPHTLEDMLPITVGDNECLECHHPDNVESEADMPLTESHFKGPVMGKGKESQGLVWVVEGYEVRDKVGARYDCMMCHAPQATNVKDLPSRFVREKSEKK